MTDNFKYIRDLENTPTVTKLKWAVIDGLRDKYGLDVMEYRADFVDALCDAVKPYITAGEPGWHLANLIYGVVMEYASLDTCQHMYLDVLGSKRSDVNDEGWWDTEIMRRIVSILILNRATEQQQRHEAWLINYQMFAV